MGRVKAEPRNSFALVVEDHPLVADSLVSCVRGCDPELEVIAADSVRAALDVLSERPCPSLIISDLTLTDANGSEAARRLRAAAPHSPLLVFTALDDPKLRSEAKEAGVVSYLIKSASVDALREQIRKIVGRHGSEEAPVPRRGGLNGVLTQKQILVLEELAAGRSNKEIAARLRISDQTVGSHMKEILGRLAVKNRTEAVVRYLEMIRQSGDRSRR